MFELKFDPANKSLAAAIGAALVAYGTGEVTAGATITHTVKKEVGDVAITETVKTTTVDTAESGTVGEDTDSSAPASGAADNTDRNNLDEKGVGKNPDFCSNAQIPFNQSGKKKGQWKKRQGVDEAAYDAWYEAEIANVVGRTATGDSGVDTGAAFGNNTCQAAAGGEIFTDAGQFMAWVAEQQTAERLTQADIDSAYQMTSTQVHDLFNPSLFANAVAAVYGFLAPIAAGET